MRKQKAKQEVQELFNQFYNEEQGNKLSSFAIENLLNKTLRKINNIK